MPNSQSFPLSIRWVASTLTGLLSTLVPQVATATCVELPPNQIEVILLETPASQNFSYSYRQLRSLTDDYNRRDIETLGLARGTASARFEVKGQVLQADGGQTECASFNIKLSYGFSPIVVYVGREFPPGTCAHNEIYRHELEHVEAYRQHARGLHGEITQQLKRRFESATPWHGERGEPGQRLQRELDERWLPYIHRLLDQVKLAQRKIDSPEEYARIGDSCDGEIKRLLKQPAR